MKINPDIIGKLSQSITTGRSLFTDLQALLRTECDALKQQDFDTFTQCTEQKTESLQLIQANIDERNQLFAEIEVAASDEGIQHILKAIPAPIAVRLETHWSELNQALLEAKALNEINQQLVFKSKDNTDRLLAILQGKSARTEVYGHSGSKNNLSAQSRLGKA